MALKKKDNSAQEEEPFKIKRPGALKRRAKRNDRTVNQQAQVDMKSGTPLQKKQANLYLKVFKPAAAERRKKRSLLA